MRIKASGMERMFGMSPNGIRLYEKQGVIRPQREESGYRTYGATELTMMRLNPNLLPTDFSTPGQVICLPSRLRMLDNDE